MNSAAEQIVGLEVGGGEKTNPVAPEDGGWVRFHAEVRKY
jgi:hypothetical protein